MPEPRLFNSVTREALGKKHATPSRMCLSWFREAYAHYDGDRTPGDDRVKFEQVFIEIVEAERALAVRAALVEIKKP